MRLRGLIERRCREMKITMRQVARALKITPEALSRKMNGKAPFKEQELRKIFKLLCFTNEQIAEGMK